MSSAPDPPLQMQGGEVNQFLACVADGLTDAGFSADTMLFPKRFLNRLRLSVIRPDDQIASPRYAGTTSTGVRAFWSNELPAGTALVFDSRAVLMIAQESRFWSGKGPGFCVQVGGIVRTNLIVRDTRAVVAIAAADLASEEGANLAVEVSCLPDRGSGEADRTAYFTGRTHRDLVEEFRSYLEMHRHLIGLSHVEITQALNDRGTDLILQREGCKIGFQIKSHHDVTEPDFSRSVKRQLAESDAHGLDRWYLLICSPLQEGSHCYSERINHLLNELSTYKSNYAEAYGPRSCIEYFDGPTPLSRKEFDSCVRQRSGQ
jgi:hypothetical protein